MCVYPRFEAAKLVMQWLCNHEDQNMQRMAVAIISILAAKVSELRRWVRFIFNREDLVAVLGLVICAHSLHLTFIVFFFCLFLSAVYWANSTVGSGAIYSKGEYQASYSSASVSYMADTVEYVGRHSGICRGCKVTRLDECSVRWIWSGPTLRWF